MEYQRLDRLVSETASKQLQRPGALDSETVGPSSLTSSGALNSGSMTLAGQAVKNLSATGSLTPASMTMAGSGSTGGLNKTSDGAVNSGNMVLAGSAYYVHDVFGADNLQIAVPTLSGTASITQGRTSSGALSINSMTLAGTATAVHNLTSSGALTIADPVLAGLTSAGNSQLADGALIPQDMTLSGVATKYAVRSATGALVMSDSTLSGSTIGSPSPTVLTQNDLAAIVAAVRVDLAPELAKINALTFTIAGVVDANVQTVNETVVAGTGQPGDEWGPA